MRCPFASALLFGVFLLFIQISKHEAVEENLDFFKFATNVLQPIINELFGENSRNQRIIKVLTQEPPCNACYLLTYMINQSRIWIKYTKKNLESWSEVVCAAFGMLKLLSKVECQGLVKIYSDTIVYLLNNLKDTRDICTILLQGYGCNLIRKPSYSIKLNTDTPKPKRGTTYNDTMVPRLRILQLTDVHFDPNYLSGSNALCQETLCCNIKSGTAQIREEGAGYWSDYRNCDLPDYFITNTLEQIAKNRKFDYIYFTGDVIHHALWNTSKNQNLKDLHFFWSTIKTNFNGHKIFPIFGNHEPHPCNLYPPEYMNQGEFGIQWLLNETADLWEDFLPMEALATVRRGGFYSVSPEPGLRIIAINSNIAYLYNFWLIFDDRDPCGQLQWLADELQKAEDNNEVVHILSHVTAGTEMVNSWAEKLQDIIRRYKNVITGIFNGHTHLDEFMLYYSKDGKPITVAYNGGSLTPYSNVNPNYKIYDVDPSTFEVLDIHTYMMDLTRANQCPKKNPKWKKLYSLTTEYKIPNGLPESMKMLTDKIVQDSDIRDLYYRNSVRYATPALVKGCDQKCQNNLVCNIVTTVASDTSNCMSLKKNKK